MGTWDIRRCRPATAYRNLATAALASAIALVLLMPVPAGLTGGTAGQTAPAPGSTGLTQGSVHMPLLVFLMRGNRETGCCA